MELTGRLAGGGINDDVADDEEDAMAGAWIPSSNPNGGLFQPPLRKGTPPL